jgi:hypothetical protein
MEDLQEADKETETILNRYRALREMGVSGDELARHPQGAAGLRR